MCHTIAASCDLYGSTSGNAVARSKPACACRAARRFTALTTSRPSAPLCAPRRCAHSPLSRHAMGS
eukprot:2623208-Pleurochrysis_carterae.AAC.2